MWKRGRVYYARFRKHGREIRCRLSTDLQAAKEMLNELRARADKADFNLIDNDFPWARLREEFLQWARQNVRDHKKYEQDLDKFEEYSSIQIVCELDQPMIVAFRDWRLQQEVSPRTINRQVGTVNNMLNKGVSWRRIGSNPLSGLSPLAHDAPKKVRRSLTLAEIQSILDASPSHLRPVWLTYMTTGLRRSELVQLLFADIDFERRALTVRASAAKNHKERDVPLDDEVLTLLAERKRQARFRKPVVGTTKKQTQQQQDAFSKTHVFVTQVNTPLRNNLLRQFYSVCKAAGIDDACENGSVDIHALRVSFITLAIEHGGNPKAIQEIVGHSSLEMTMNVYAKATDRSKRAAINTLPFATLSSPDHTVSFVDAHKERTETSRKTEGLTG